MSGSARIKPRRSPSRRTSVPPGKPAVPAGGSCPAASETAMVIDCDRDMQYIQAHV